MLSRRSHRGKPIPAVWRIDIEPDEVGEQPWDGFADTVNMVEDLRDRLSDRSGHAVRPTWFIRLDPEIERCFGRPDYVVQRYGELFDRLVDHGDPFGIHVHPQRWDSERSVVFSDHTDRDWTRHCLTVSAETYAHCFGEPVRRSSQGGYFLTEDVLDAAVSLGIEVDMTPEPGLGPVTDDPSFGAYATAESGDFRTSPRRPYYPSRRSMNSPSISNDDRRPILVVPLTSYDYMTALAPLRRRVSNALRRRPRYHFPLNPWKQWPSPHVYWDLVERAADEQDACYFAFAMRTDPPGSEVADNARILLEYLPNHPISRRLQFVDPLGPEIRALAEPSRR